mgnify:CR=1 FL=1
MRYYKKIVWSLITFKNYNLIKNALILIKSFNSLKSSILVTSLFEIASRLFENVRYNFRAFWKLKLF